MTKTAVYLNYQVLPSEIEALLVEAQLIKIYQPPYNTLLKDDKSPLYILLTKEEFPRVLAVRKRNLLLKKYRGEFFGPFPSAYQVKQLLKLLRPIMPWCNAKRQKKMRRCFEHHLGLCPGVCTGEISCRDYQKNLMHLSDFLQGKTALVLKKLTIAMKAESERENYEQAATYRDQIKMIKQLTSDGCHLKNDLYLPNLNQEKNYQAQVLLREYLSTYFSLPSTYMFERIEGYDVSNTMGKQAVVSQVVFTGGVPDNQQYRLYNIRGLDTPNDFAMLKQAIQRRLQHHEWQLPNLFLIDGGKGQVRSALIALRENCIDDIPIIGLAKDPDRIIIPYNIVSTGRKMQIDWQILKLENDNPALQLLQQVRDEAHRFGKKAHTKRRQKQLFIR